MKSNKFPPKKNVAQAMVEFAIVLPILLLLLYGLLEAGRLLFIYSTIVTASRQAVRYGSATGQGGDYSGEGGPNNTGVPRYQDCYGIRRAAQRVDYLNAFDNIDIAIAHDGGSGSATAYCGGDPVTSTPNSDNSFTPANTNTDRLVITIKGDYNPIVPKIVPFLARTVTNGKPITAISARTIIMSVTIPGAGGSGGGTGTTATTLVTSPNPSEPGQTFTATATLSSTSGTPTGTVDFSIDGVVLCTRTLVGGTASCDLSLTTTKTVVATYHPDSASFETSNSNVVQIVGKSSTVTYVNDMPDPSIKGNSVTIQVTVSNTFSGGTTPSGTVTVTTAAGGCNITLNSSGVGSCNVTYNALGTTTITAVYNPDANHLTSTGTSPHEVLSTAPTASKTPVPPPATATFTPVPPTAIPPTPVTGCNSVRDSVTSIKINKYTMYLEMTNNNPYPVTVGSVFVAWNYAAGHVPGDSSLYLQKADLNGTVFWTGSLNQPSALLPLSTAVVLPPNTKSTVTFTFDKTYTTSSGTEQMQVQFSTPGCESYPIILPANSPTITPAPSVSLKAQVQSGGTDTSGETQFRYRVYNTGSSATSNISTRIYFTLDGAWTASSYVLATYSDTSGAATVTGPTLASGNVYYFTVSYGSASLAVGSYWEFYGSLHANYWPATYDGFNDFWHTPSVLPASFADWPTIPIYMNGSPVWGSTP